jgi:tRNA threonylcarbamoyladenosine dehydratase
LDFLSLSFNVTSISAEDERRFGGIARLYGEGTLERFRQTHVCVLGIGGVGSWAVEALARSGIGELTLIDPDHVALSNINRQLQALQETLGMPKVNALGQRLLEINPLIRLHRDDRMVDNDNLEQTLPEGCDFLLDCIDSYRIKAALIAHCRSRRLPLITSGGAGGKRDPGAIRLADLSRSEQDPLLSRTRKLLRQQYGFPTNPKRRFSVPCVFSIEQHRSSLVCMEQRDSSLNCAGFGSSMAVTAGFGLAMAAQVLERIERRLGPST